MTTKAQRKQRLLELADVIERIPDHQFNYDHWCATFNGDGERTNAGMFVNDLLGNIPLSEKHCNTAGCVAGWGAVLGLEAGFHPEHYMEMTVNEYAQEYLGLTSYESSEIFMGGALAACGFYEHDADWNNDAIREAATTAEVAKMLRMIAEGEVEL